MADGPAATGMRRLRPQLIFVAVGALLFVLAPRQPDAEVRYSPQARQAAWALHAGQLGVPELSEAEKQKVTRRLLEDEMLYREALRLGLDRQDHIVRQRLAQKVLFLTEEQGGAGAASDSALRAHHAAHPERWQIPQQVSFRQVFVRDTEASQLAALRAQLAQGEDEAASQLGDALPAPRTMTRQTQAGVEAAFGPAFAHDVFALEPGGWLGPVASRYGAHLVQVSEQRPAHAGAFEEVEHQVRLDFEDARRAQARQALLDRLYERYSVDPADYPELDPAPDPAPDRMAALQEER